MNQVATTNLGCSDSVYDCLEQIAEVSSKNAKMKLLQEHLQDPYFRALIKQAVDPFITFGVKKLPTPKGPGTHQFRAETLKLMAELRHRSLTGNAAQEAIAKELSVLAPKSRELLSRILRKNLKAGFTASSVNSARPGTIYVFKCQLSNKLADYCEKITINPDYPWTAELKEDGVRGFALEHKNPTGEFFSRSGKPLSASEELKDEVILFFRMWKDYWSDDAKIVLDGELVSLDGVFNDVVGDIRRKSARDTVGLKLIDLIPTKEFDAGRSKKAYWDRRAMLHQFMEDNGEAFDRIKLTTEWLVKSVDEAFVLANDLIQNGKEGIILKDPHGLWQNKRTKDWLKVKDKNTVDLVVKRLEIGNPDKGFSHCLGAVVCDFTTYVDEVQRTVEVSISSGFTIEQREYYWQHQDELVGRLIEVSYHQITPDFSMRHPVFEKFRDDKPIEDGQG